LRTLQVRRFGCDCRYRGGFGSQSAHRKRDVACARRCVVGRNATGRTLGQSLDAGALRTKRDRGPRRSCPIAL